MFAYFFQRTPFFIKQKLYYIKQFGAHIIGIGSDSHLNVILLPTLYASPALICSNKVGASGLSVQVVRATA